MHSYLEVNDFVDAVFKCNLNWKWVRFVYKNSDRTNLSFVKQYPGLIWALRYINIAANINPNNIMYRQFARMLLFYRYADYNNVNKLSFVSGMLEKDLNVAYYDEKLIINEEIIQRNINYAKGVDIHTRDKETADIYHCLYNNYKLKESIPILMKDFWNTLSKHPKANTIYRVLGIDNFGNVTERFKSDFTGLLLDNHISLYGHYFDPVEVLARIWNFIHHYEFKNIDIEYKDKLEHDIKNTIHNQINGILENYPVNIYVNATYSKDEYYKYIKDNLSNKYIDKYIQYMWTVEKNIYDDYEEFYNIIFEYLINYVLYKTNINSIIKINEREIIKQKKYLEDNLFEGLLECFDINYIVCNPGKLQRIATHVLQGRIYDKLGNYIYIDRILSDVKIKRKQVRNNEKIDDILKIRYYLNPLFNSFSANPPKSAEELFQLLFEYLFELNQGNVSDFEAISINPAIAIYWFICLRDNGLNKKPSFDPDFSIASLFEDMFDIHDYLYTYKNYDIQLLDTMILK